MKRKLPSRFRTIVFGSLQSAKRELLGAFVCVLASTALTLAAPWPLKLLFDHVLLAKPVPPELKWLDAVVQPGSNGSLVWLALTVIVLAVLSAAFTYFQLLMTSRIGLDIVHRLRSALFDQLQSMSLSFHAQTQSGELLSKLVSDTNTLRDVYSEYLVSVITHILTIIGICVVMFMIDSQLAMLVLLTFPLLFYALLAILRTVRISARRQRQQESLLVSRLSEVLGAMPLVQAFGREAFESERFTASSARSKQESIRTAQAEAAAARLVEVARAFGTALMIVLGGMQVLRGRISPGDFLVFSTYIVNLYKPIRVLARLSSRLFKASASAERVRAILEQVPEIQDRPNAVVASVLRGDIEFRDICFAYEGASPVLHHVSFEVLAGQHVALVGSSGAGKSTIVNLLLRFHDASSGSVRIDGIDVRDYDRQSLRSQVGVVLQDSLLFGATIAENIAYGKVGATSAEIQHASQMALAHDFIVALPDGYQTILGENGARLSGGQRQRLCLARALIRDPAILIMDEPTSALGFDTEAEIRARLRQLRRGRTTVIIAHQLQTVMDADLILVLKDGCIVEHGTHEQLVRHRGHYCDLFQIAVPREPVTTLRSFR